MPNPPNPPKTGGIMSRKILGIPAPIAIAVVLVAGYLVYRHYKTTSAANTSGTSQATSVDPNAIDPATGLTYGAEQQAGLNAMGNPSTNGTGVGGVGGGMSVGDLEGLLSALQGFQGTTNYYYGGGGTGAAPTPTNTEPGQGTLTFAPQFIIPSSTPNPAPANPTSPNPSSTGAGPNPSSTFVPSAFSGTLVTPSSFTPGAPSMESQINQPLGPSTKTVAYNGNLPTTQFGTPSRNIPTSPAEAGHPGGYSSNKKQGVYATH